MVTSQIWTPFQTNHRFLVERTGKANHHWGLQWVDTPVRCLICLHPGGSCLRKFRQQIISTEQFMQKIAQLQTQQVPLTARETSCFLESIGKRWLHLSCQQSAWLHLFHDCCGHPGAERILVYFKLYFHMCMYTYMCMIMYV